MRGLALVMLIGCASPDPRRADSILITADTAHVASLGSVPYELQLATDGLLLPEQLNFAGASWIASTEACPTEAGVGVNVFPAVRAAAKGQGGDPPSPTDTSTKIEIELNGPAIARVRSHWAVDYACEGHNNTASGDLVLTLFPSGRIIRRDEHVFATQTTLTMPNMPCGCAQASDYYFTSSWTFPEAAVARDDHDLPASNSLLQACAIVSGVGGVALAWPDSHTRFHPTTSNAFVYDWDAGATTLGTGEHAVTTRMQLGTATSCPMLLAKLEMPAISVAGEITTVGDDGIYAVDHPESGTFAITASTTIPPGWAIALHLGGADHIKITGEGADGYVVEDDHGIGRTLIYFPKELAAGSSLSVEVD